MSENIVVIVDPPDEVNASVLPPDQVNTTLPPPEEITIIVSTGGGGGSSTLADLTDVDLVTTPPAVGSVLVYEADGVWRPAMSPDQKNFRGDWQDPTSTLLFSDDFATADSLDNYTFSTYGSALTASSAEVSPITRFPGVGTPPFANALALAMTSNASARHGYLGVLKDSALPAGSVATKASAYLADNLGGSNANYFGARLLNTAPSGDFSEAVLGGVGYNTTSTAQGWAASRFELALPSGYLGLACCDFTNSAATSIASPGVGFAGLEVYGAPSASDLYQMGDVVVHGGSYYRSLFNNNIEIPGTGEKWLLIPGI